MVKNSTSKKNEDKGLDPDREAIIQIIDQLQKLDEYANITDIIQHLNHPKFMQKGRFKVNAQKTFSLLRNRSHFIKGKKISNVKFSELLNLFKLNFASDLSKLENDVVEISSSFDDYYFYYYKSYSGNTHEGPIKFAIVGFKLDNLNEEWDTGRMYYLSDTAHVFKVFEVEIIKPKPDHKRTIYLCAKFEGNVNFFTLQNNDFKYKDRAIIPLTYSVTDSPDKYPSIGVGIFEKTNHKECLKKINEAKNSRGSNHFKGVNDEFINFLHHGKIVVKDKIEYKKEDFKKKQFNIFKNVKGIWSGVYLRSDFGPGVAKGGVCKFVLRISGHGKCEFYFDESKDSIIRGFVILPYGNPSIMKIFSDYLENEKTYKSNLILSTELPKSLNVYRGVVTGWSTRTDIYTSPVYMKKIVNDDSNTELEKALSEIKPKRILRADLSERDSEFIKVLKDVEDEFMATFNNCVDVPKENK